MQSRETIRDSSPCRALLCVICLLLCLSTTLQAKVEVPESSQVPIFLKLLTYDRSLATDDATPILICVLAKSGSPASAASAKAILTALEGMRGKTINGRKFEVQSLDGSEGLSNHLDEKGIDILYVAEGNEKDLERIKSATRHRNVLTLSGTGDIAKRGLSIGLGLHEGRPRIMVNLEALQEEGHVLDARVLRLCEVVTEP